MSTNKTKNLNLHSWVETDPVLMREFNENFGAIDSAVADGVKIRTGSYVGTGKFHTSYTNTLYFDIIPKWLLIQPKQTIASILYSIETIGAFQIDVSAVCDACMRSSSGKAIVYQLSGNEVGQYMWLTETEGCCAINWYATNSATDAKSQANDANFTYYYTAIG